MDIKIETAAQMESRLRKVVSHATFKIYDEPYSFQEIPLKEFSFQFDQNALAVVRDDTIVSQFIPSRSKDQERFAIFRFHFDPEIPNSGFVGWLASHLKQTTGTGVTTKTSTGSPSSDSV